MKILNLTPHKVTLCGEDGETIAVFEPAGTPARCATTTRTVDSITLPTGDSVPVKRTVFGEVVGLPESDPDTILIVSAIVASAVKGTRDDCVVPNDAVRDGDGRIVGCRSFAVV